MRSLALSVLMMLAACGPLPGPEDGGSPFCSYCDQDADCPAEAWCLLAFDSRFSVCAAKCALPEDGVPVPRSAECEPHFNCEQVQRGEETATKCVPRTGLCG